MWFQNSVFSIALPGNSYPQNYKMQAINLDIKIIAAFIRTFILIEFTVILRTCAIDMKVAKLGQMKNKSALFTILFCI